ncbi:MAG: hypothetical protein NOF05_11370 [Candidatus Accumulibacter phosphatis]|nr:hypothetical protein [Candidatus Accumulibacter phosphatis]
MRCSIAGQKQGAREIQSSWASCPLTENGGIRIMSPPGYPNALPAGAIAERLAAVTATSHHVFWPDAVSILDSGRLPGMPYSAPTRRVTFICWHERCSKAAAW